MIKAKIDDKEVELKPEQLELGEGFALITPDKVPDGYYNEDAVQKRIQERVKNTAENARKEAESDEEFQKRILSKFNISLGEDGKPKGLKPDVDVEEVKKNLTKEISSQYETQINEFKEKLTNRDKAVIESSILSAVSGVYKDDWVKPYGDKPLVVKQFSDRFTVDENGNAVLKSEDGGIRYKGDGSPMTAKDYLLSDEFAELRKDQRQSGSGFGEGSTGGSPAGNPSEWSVKQKNLYIEKNGLQGYKQLLQNSRKK